MDYIIATHNMKKRDELQRILAPLGIRVLLAEEAGVELTDVEETGTTFEENALLKAESGCKESGMPCIADDSGLAVDYLDGAPGVYSARYAGEHGNDAANNEKLMRDMQAVPDEQRTAAFVCTIACVFPDGRQFTVRGECRGRMLRTPLGEGGFGYDPYFLSDDLGCTLAQASEEQKNAVSHRGRAMRQFCRKIVDYLAL